MRGKGDFLIDYLTWGEQQSAMIESCKNLIQFVFDSKDNCLDSITKLMNMTTSH